MEDVDVDAEEELAVNLANPAEDADLVEVDANLANLAKDANPADLADLANIKLFAYQIKLN
jgi:hypothetical protein